MITSLVAFIHRHVLLFAVVKFCASFVIGFGLGLYWGGGVIMANADRAWLDCEILPGPDYRLYLITKYVETGSGFLETKAESTQIGPIKAFENFALDIVADVEIANFPAVLIWCRAFGQFITVARPQ
jgi:hypothetical protein